MKMEYWFACLKGISGKRKYELRKRVPDTSTIFYGKECDLKKIGFQEKELAAVLESRNTPGMENMLEKQYEELLEKGIRLVKRGDNEYPKRLEYIDVPPYMLYIKGKLPDWDNPCAAVVGARSCTPYGRKYAREFGKILAGHGVTVVSGMACGVDGFAQRGALMAEGITVAVLGCGPDICYPKENFGLYHDIIAYGGAVLSEYPPGTPPMSAHFPARNRIISGLSDIVLIIEARAKSGSLITADMALEQGKDVYALPGPVDSALSAGCNELIRQGAGILLSPEKLLEEYGFGKDCFVQNVKENQIKLESEENLLYSCLDLSPKCLQQLLEETGLEPSVLMGLLTDLTLRGYAEEISKNYYVRRG